VTGLLTPGVYRQPLEPIRAAGRLARGDIPVLLGYATRGPVGQPVRVYSVRQYEDVFGPARATGFLWHAVKGFFETGGRTAYVIRVATTSARAASVDQATAAPFTWRAEAAFPWRMIDPRRLSGAALTEAQGWIQVFERGLLARGRRSPDPGGWGNGLSVQITRTSRVRTETVPEVIGDGTAVRLASMAGLEEASVLELSQEGVPDPEIRVPAAVDRARQLVHWHRAPDRLRLDRPIRVASVEFDVTVLLDGRPEQTFAARAPHPAHTYALAGTLEAECRSLVLRPVFRRPAAGNGWADETPETTAALLAGADWADPGRWPRDGTYQLRGGADGLEDVSRRTWLDVLSGVAELDDAAMLAAPDLVLPDVAPVPVPASPRPAVDCADLAPRPLGHLSGVVTAVGTSGEDVPLAGVEVDVAGPGGLTVTGAAGRFTLSGVEVGLLTLRLRKPGHEPLEVLVQSSPFASAAPVRLTMARIVTPRALHADEVLEVQQAMANPTYVGPYKVAFLDPPTARSRLDEIATWRSRLGDNARMGFFAPWLTLPVADAAGRPLVCPPSGHVCGAFAAGEFAAGVHRTGANLPLRYVDGTTLAIGDEEQGGLNPVGVNAVRAFPGRGIRAYGSRTLSSDPQWRFLTARRVVDAIERTLERALHWMVFEPNNLITRQAMTATATTLLGMLHRDGVLAGTAPEEAFAVRCDEDNNPAATRDAGQLVVDVAVAPTNPYEFVFFRLGRTLDALDVTENLR
jgi:uncharacterized protein